MTDARAAESARMISKSAWRWVLLPGVARLAAFAPRDHRVGWNRFWPEVGATGDGGDVVWDTSDPAEMQRYLSLLRTHLDPALPIVDVGCGNGRLSRILAAEFAKVVGVGLSAAAIDRARQESAGTANLTFQALDLTGPGSGRQLADLLGPANVFVRGVFHVLDSADRRRMAENLRPVLGTRGRLFLSETDYRGGSLGYLRHLGARPGHIPIPLQRAIRLLPRPDHFGPSERAADLPAARWVVHAEGATRIDIIPLSASEHRDWVPGYFAVLSPRAAVPVQRRKACPGSGIPTR